MALVTVSPCYVTLLLCLSTDSLQVVFEWDHAIQTVYPQKLVGFSCPLYR
jgi:hypothetical protein